MKMDLKEVQENWNKFGNTDPLWGILAWPEKDENRWQIDEFFATGVAEISEVLEYVEQQAPLRRGRALDFGCGVGRLSQALTAHFERVDGVDISPAMITLAQEYNRYPESCHYHLNDRDDLSLFSPDFDFIYSNITLQHMPPRYSQAYIGEFLRILAPGGILVFQIPSTARRLRNRLTQPLRPTRPFRWLQKIRHGDQPVMDMYGIPKDEVLRLVQTRGGTVLDVQADSSADAMWHSFRYLVTLQ
ncbi:MAG: class I SAM-dependent methyltransferase [Caldilineales bacterium]|nr:class I SAM-dependent methyltransferase [Caldilineales bacterium]